jgi:hypothetical protein
MSESNRQLPRFIPTLTEVVDTSNMPRLVIKPIAEVEALVERVHRQVQPIFERRLQDEFERMLRIQVTRQWADASTKVQSEMANLVRQIVQDELMQQSKGKSNR